MKKNFIIISNGGGGIATFQYYLIKNIINRKDRVFLIDKKKNHTLKYFNKSEKKKINTLFCNPLYEQSKVKKHIKILKKNYGKLIFLFNNPTLFALYFIFIKLHFRYEKINLVLHSNILNLKTSQILINFASSLFSHFIDRVYFVSKFTKKWWLKYFFFYNFSNHRVFYNSVKIPKIINKRNNRTTIGFVGRLEKEKGIHIFSNIAKSLIKYNFHFEIFGNGSFKKKIFKHKNIKINDWMKQENIYKKIDILLVTSPTENCPFTVLEAKSYGIPTVSISKGGIKEIVKNNHNGIILKNYDFDLIKNAIFKISKNLHKFKKNCLLDRKKYNEKIIFKKFLNEI